MAEPPPLKFALCASLPHEIKALVFLSTRNEAAHGSAAPLKSRVFRWWRAPLWLLALATGAKSFSDNPIIGSKRLNRWGLHTARLKLAHRIAWSRRARLAGAVNVEWRRQFDRNGFVAIPDFLPAETFERMQKAVLESRFDTREQQQGNTTTRRVPVDEDVLRQVPDLRSFIEDQSRRPLLAYIAGTKSEPLNYIQTISAGSLDGPTDPQLELHSDTFHPSLKAWLFLTDVTNDQGALTYVAGSHLLTRERIEWERAKSISIAAADRLSQRGSFRIGAEDLASLQLPPPQRFSVPPNTLVAIDTCGFHARGPSSQPFVRVEIWSYSRRNPFLPWTGFDLLSWNPLARRRERWLMSAIDFLDRVGLRRQHWRIAGHKRPIDA